MLGRRFRCATGGDLDSGPVHMSFEKDDLNCTGSCKIKVEMKTPAEIYRDHPFNDPQAPADTKQRAVGGAEAAAERVRVAPLERRHKPRGSSN